METGPCSRWKLNVVVWLTVASVLSSPAEAQTGPSLQQRANALDGDHQRAVELLFLIMDKLEGTELSSVIELGDRDAFLAMFESGELDVDIDPELDKEGRFRPAAARWFGRTGLVNPILLIRPVRDPDATIWHETLHAYKDHKDREFPCLGEGELEQCLSEEAYTWLQESRYDWLTKVAYYESKYKLAEQGQFPRKKLKELWEGLEKIWKDDLYNLTWPNPRGAGKTAASSNRCLAGPYESIDSGGTCKVAGGSPGMKGLISRECVAKLDAFLGIEVDIGKIRKLYPPLKDEVASNTAKKAGAELSEPTLTPRPKYRWVRASTPRIEHSTGAVFTIGKSSFECVGDGGHEGKDATVTFTEPPEVLLPGKTINLSLNISAPKGAPFVGAHWNTTNIGSKLTRSFGYVKASYVSRGTTGGPEEWEPAADTKLSSTTPLQVLLGPPTATITLTCHCKRGNSYVIWDYERQEQ